MKFHFFEIKSVVTFLIIEPKKGEYIWVYMKLNKSLRNGLFSAEFAKYLLFYLRGTHHIHWLKRLKSFSTLSKELGWVTRSKSELFESCNYSKAHSLKSSNPLYLLLKKIMTHKVLKRKPKFLSFMKREDENWVIKQIKLEYKIKH